MTAPDDNHLREQIAALFWEHDPANADPEDLADALLPLVVAYGNQRAADVLADVAIEWRRLSDGTAPAARYIRARAAALRATTQPKETT